jgi:hypothetical protein
VSTEDEHRPSRTFDQVIHARNMLAKAMLKRRRGGDATLDDLIAMNAMDLAQESLGEAHRRDAARRAQDGENEHQ